VTPNDVIVSVNAVAGAETGMEVIRQVYPKLGIVPGQLLAPNYSEDANVAIALSAKAQSINGCFKAMALVDLSTVAAKTYTDVKTAKEASGLSSPFCEVLWPRLKVGAYTFPYSSVMAALTEYTDANNNNVPYKSPSNEMMGVTGACLADGTEVYLDQDQANTVNSFGVVTALNINGWRSWGNYTAAYPSSTDAKDIWIAVRRMFNWQGNTFILSYFDKVDDPMNRRLIDTIVDTENIRCAAYAPEYWAGAYIEYLADDNPITEILSGNVTFRQHIAPYTPAQYITNIIDYDLNTLQAALQG
jgi:phage tail sheath protein FI